MGQVFDFFKAKMLILIMQKPPCSAKGNGSLPEQVGRWGKFCMLTMEKRLELEVPAMRDKKLPHLPTPWSGLLPSGWLCRLGSV